MTLAILFSLKMMESLENGLQPQSGVIPLFLITTELLASPQSCHNIEADAWCKRALNGLNCFKHIQPVIPIGTLLNNDGGNNRYGAKKRYM